MGSFDIWDNFGFTENPYSQSTLKADELGETLLAGRDKEIKILQKRIGSTGAHPSVEGPIGAGKTSLVNVAIYRMQQRCLTDKAFELYLPAAGEFQPAPSTTDFEQTFYYVVAQTIIKNKDLFPAVGLPQPDISVLDRWLNNPQYTNKSGGGQVAGFGLEVGYGSEPNSAAGFAASGFPEAVRKLLEESFPPGCGGIVCILDNLEILQSAGRARTALDELRDRVFNIPQIRWVLCGSRGIVSRARTERLSGMMQTPLIVQPIDDASAVEAIKRRIDHFGTVGAVPPVTPDGFDFIYQTLNKNLREALTKSHDFSHWLDDRGDEEDWDEFPDEEERTAMLNGWIMELAEHALQDAKDIRKRDWQFFDALCESGGRAGSAEFEDFGFKKQQQMTNSVTLLAEANLISRETDPENATRTINAVTPTGWLVSFFRQNFDASREVEGQEELAIPGF